MNTAAHVSAWPLAQSQHGTANQRSLEQICVVLALSFSKLFSSLRQGDVITH